MSNEKDLHHSFPTLIDELALKYGDRSKLIGGDGIIREIITIEGSINGKNGKFEWIIEANNAVNHRFFNRKGYK